MMVAMMLPSLVPMLLRYRRAIRDRNEARLAGLTALASAGYFFVWFLFGTAAYALGVALTAGEMRWPDLARAVPVATGAVLLIAGYIQLTPWKARQLQFCSDAAPGGPPAGGAHGAWQYGVHMGARCSLCCSGLMMILLVTGIMSLCAMAIVTAAITIERFAPRPKRAARVTGVIVIAAGALSIARAMHVL